MANRFCSRANHLRVGLASFGLLVGCGSEGAGTSPFDGGGGVAAGEDGPGSSTDLDSGTTSRDVGRSSSDGVAPSDGRVGGCLLATTVSAVTDPAVGTLTVAMDPKPSEIADPSVYFPPSSPAGALAYSSIPTGPGGAADQGGLRTRLAVSADKGATWTFVAEANTPSPVPPPAGVCANAAACTATIVNETPSLVYDPDDPVEARRWKLFTHRYQVVKDAGKAVLLYTVGHIALFTARVPAGPWSAPEVVAGWPGSTFSSVGARYQPTDDPATAACGAFGEPGATRAPDGSLHLAMACIAPPFADPTLDIVLLRSTDHAATWKYLSTPLRGTDGACFGGSGKRVNAVDLFSVGTTEYLMATPEAANVRNGCVVIPFANPGMGTLARDASGTVKATRHLVPRFAPTDAIHYSGACTFSEGAPATGYTMSHLTLVSGKPELHELLTGVGGP